MQRFSYFEIPEVKFQNEKFSCEVSLVSFDSSSFTLVDVLVEVAVDSLLVLTNFALTDSLFLSAVLSGVSDSTLELSAKSPLPEKLTIIFD